jgi:hypothetical protein
VNPSIATTSPSRTFASTAAARDMNSDIETLSGWTGGGLFRGRRRRGQIAAAQNDTKVSTCCLNADPEEPEMTMIGSLFLLYLNYAGP